MNNDSLYLPIDFDALDPQVTARDDFYRHSHGRWLDSYVIPEDRSMHGAFHALRDEAELRVRAIVEDLAAGKVSEDNPDGEKAGALYRQFMDEDAVESAGYAPLLPDIELIDQATSHAELAVAMGKLMYAGAVGIFDAGVEVDMNQPDRYSLFLVQSGLRLPSEAFYHLDEYAEVRGAYAAHLDRARQMVAAGIDLPSWASEDFGAEVLNFETALAGHHWDQVACRDAVNSNNPMTFAEFTAAYPGLDWASIFSAMNASLTPDTPLNVRQPSFFAALGELWEATDLLTLKRWLLALVFAARGELLPAEFVAEKFNFERLLHGAPELRARWKRALTFVESGVSEAVGREFVARHFPPEDKARMLDLVDHLIAAYHDSISQLDWMGEDTRARALDKLASFTTKIGYPDKWRDYAALNVGANLVDSARQMSFFEHDYQFSKLTAGEIDRTEWQMPPQMVNAYYHPLYNEIVFPAAILQPPFFDSDMPDAAIYGAIGAVIGHEIGHGFDDQGSHYDGDGRLRNWWSEADRERFDERAGRLIAQYDALTPTGLDESHKVKGALTVGENIGDLGGLSIAWKAYHLALAERGVKDASEVRIDFPQIPAELADAVGAQVVDGQASLTGAQVFFYAWSRVWRSKVREQMAKQLLEIDPHSPAEFRCNAVLENIDAFHDTFHTRPGDGMWREPAERIRIW